MAIAETLADRITGHRIPFTALLSTLAQVSFALTRLHSKGWVYLGLRPGIIALGKPVFLTDFSYIMPIDQKPDGTFYHAGYSPPELLTEEPLDARADIYALGAILFHALNGQPMAETGAELSTWEAPMPMAGVPQVLQRCLGTRETRYARMEDLHHDLLRLARRYAPRHTYRISTATTIGLEPTRTTNQDAFAVLQGEYETEVGSQTWAVACVADGMGGMAAGEVASEIAVKTVLLQAAEMFASSKLVSPFEQTEGVKSWAVRANERVCNAMEERNVCGGCTLIVACLIGSRLAIAHVGDCRLYHIRDRKIKLLTRDHSLAMAMVLQGEAELENIRQHPDRSRVTRSLGERQNVPDYFVDTLEPETGEATLEVGNGDTLLLCSDGLWEPVTDDEMRNAIAHHADDLSAAGRTLLKIALQRGGQDNATIILLRVEEKPADGED